MGVSLFSFFSGVGMLDLAFERNGYNIVMVNEYDQRFLGAYQYSRQLFGIAPPFMGITIRVRSTFLKGVANGSYSV